MGENDVLQSGLVRPHFERVEDLASRVHQLKERLAKQNVSVRLEHYWELAHARRSFAEFKCSVEQLEEDGDSQCNRDYERIEATWNERVPAVDALLATLPGKSLTREEQ